MTDKNLQNFRNEYYDKKHQWKKEKLEIIIPSLKSINEEEKISKYERKLSNPSKKSGKEDSSKIFSDND